MLPVIYVVLVLRAVMPLVLPASTVFVLLTAIFALLGWPIVARGVRAHRRRPSATREYAVAGARARRRAARASSLRHLLPAARGYLRCRRRCCCRPSSWPRRRCRTSASAFPTRCPTWGTMLQDAANVALLAEAPWTLAPAVAIFVVVLAVNLAVQGGGRAPVQLEP